MSVIEVSISDPTWAFKVSLSTCFLTPKIFFSDSLLHLLGNFVCVLITLIFSSWGVFVLTDSIMVRCDEAALRKSFGYNGESPTKIPSYELTLKVTRKSDIISELLIHQFIPTEASQSELSMELSQNNVARIRKIRSAFIEDVY